MKYKALLVGAVALVMLSVNALQATASTSMDDLGADESILMCDTVTDGTTTWGIGTDAGLYLPRTTMPAYYIGGATNVMVNWSDDIIFHQFPVGQKVRTEVILTNLDTNGAFVFTLTAHFKIQKIPSLGAPYSDDYPTVWSGRLVDAYWVDGKVTSAYTCEINSEGVLLYGYNWETRGLSAGWYRLVFWVEIDADFPATYLDPVTFVDTGMPITYNSVNIVSGDPADIGDKMFGFPTVVDAMDMSYLDLELLPKATGRNK